MSATINNKKLRGIEGEVKRLSLVRAVPGSRGTLRVHAAADGTPLCGGGHKAKSASAWQTDLAEPNCQQCLAILKRQKEYLKYQTEVEEVINVAEALRQSIGNLRWKEAAVIAFALGALVRDVQQACLARSKPARNQPPRERK